jgi:hypothetical protein
MLRGGNTSRGDARLHDSSAIAMGNGSKCAIDGGMAAPLRWATVAAMGDGGGNGRQQVLQWETATAEARSQWTSMVVVQWMAGQQQQRNGNRHEWQWQQRG